MLNLFNISIDSVKCVYLRNEWFYLNQWETIVDLELYNIKCITKHF
jgi:hypothetical protein